ncbi:hypothetical protein MKW98_006887 [Papaver atlanticum]|uniref:Uncharacterized protein n=1 Tax=Papaver atlanticum TaxID=357466 RepID=A0AAD4SU95_9MAGN|nr:hypothetical protein MKW98_006887 [Papaver atlanticum]
MAPSCLPHAEVVFTLRTAHIWPFLQEASLAYRLLKMELRMKFPVKSQYQKGKCCFKKLFTMWLWITIVSVLLLRHLHLILLIR